VHSQFIDEKCFASTLLVIWNAGSPAPASSTPAASCMILKFNQRLGTGVEATPEWRLNTSSASQFPNNQGQINPSYSNTEWLGIKYVTLDQYNKDSVVILTGLSPSWLPFINQNQRPTFKKGRGLSPIKEKEWRYNSDKLALIFRSVKTNPNQENLATTSLGGGDEHEVCISGRIWNRELRYFCR